MQALGDADLAQLVFDEVLGNSGDGGSAIDSESEGSSDPDSERERR